MVGLESVASECKDGKCRTEYAGPICEGGKCGTVRNAGAEMVGLESVASECKDGKCRTEYAGPICEGGKCGSGICGTNMQGWKILDNRVWKACLRIRLPKLMSECKNGIGLSSVVTVTSNSCTFVYLLMSFLCVCFLLPLGTYKSEF